MDSQGHCSTHDASIAGLHGASLVLHIGFWCARGLNLVTERKRKENNMEVYSLLKRHVHTLLGLVVVVLFMKHVALLPIQHTCCAFCSQLIVIAASGFVPSPCYKLRCKEMKNTQRLRTKTWKNDPYPSHNSHPLWSQNTPPKTPGKSCFHRAESTSKTQQFMNQSKRNTL